MKQLLYIRNRIKLGMNSMHGNSLYLMLAQGIMMVCGYLFWIIAAKFYSPSDVGLAGTLISVSLLISQISILGLNNTLVQFLPKAKDKNGIINAALLYSTIASLVISTCYVLGVNIFSPELSFVRHNLALLLLFIVSMALVTVNTFTDSVFLAYRATKYNVIVYSGYSLARVALPAALVGFGAIGIFIAHMLGVVIAAILSFYFMARKFTYRLSINRGSNIARQFTGYSSANYIAGFLWGFPLLIAPLLVVNGLGAESAAYFYMVMMIINILVVIPTSGSQSLFAEASHESSVRLRSLVLRSLKFTLTLTGIAVLCCFLFGRFAISVFGADYADQGLPLLYCLAVATLLVCANMTGNVVLKVQKKLKTLIVLNAVCAASTMALIALFLPLGLIGVGLGYLAGQIILSLLFAVLIIVIPAAKNVSAFRRILTMSN